MNTLGKFCRYAALAILFSTFFAGLAQAGTVSAAEDYVLDPSSVTASTKGGVCKGVNDYPLMDLEELATEADYLHVQLWDRTGSFEELGNAEYEVVLRANEAPGGRFNVTELALDLNDEKINFRGHVWELQGCGDAGALQNMDESIERRLEGGVNTKGYLPVEWAKKFFVPAVGGSTNDGSEEDPDENVGSNDRASDDANVDADTAMAGCEPADTNTIPDDAPADITIKGPAIVQPYWDGLPQVRAMVASGTEVELIDVSGAFYAYEDNEACNHNLALEFKNGDDLEAVYLSDIVDEGHAVITSTGDDQDDYDLGDYNTEAE